MESTVTTRWGSAAALRYAIFLTYDAIAALCGLYGALLVRLSGEVPSGFASGARGAIPLLVGIKLATVYAARLHCWSFRMSGLSEAVRLVFAMMAASLAFALAWSGLPRSVYVLEFFFTTSLMAGFRFAPRFVEGWYAEWQRRGSPGAVKAIIVGASGAGDLLARDLLRSEDGKYLVVGFVDDDPAKLGMHVSGKPVLGNVRDLARLIEQHQVSTVLLAVPDLPAERIREILAICSSSKASFKTIPASYAFLDERISAAMLHDLSPDDLLPRPPVAFDDEEIQSLVHGRRVLVTGAGGTIGGEICRQLAEHGVSRLVMVDMNENELYLRTRRLQEDYPSVRLHPEVADIRELQRLHRLAAQYHPEFVFHAAAHKHVPLMEYAPEEAVKNNVFGTLNVALMAHEIGSERLVVISTDKAVNPTSVMGASKRIAELVVRDLASRSKTRMTAVRFGNVLGSAGSVVPIFKQQIERGGPVTVTHPDCTRYFMTVSEAVGLVLLAGLGGYGELCVLDMGEPIRIDEMARSLITMAGRIPEKEIAIVYTGLRPGEKLFEELLTEEEEQNVLVRNRINVAKSPPPPADLANRLSVLKNLATTGDRPGLLAAIKALVPTYRRTPGQPIPVPASGLALETLAPAGEPSSKPTRRLPGMDWVQALTDI
jgi:FlaA1/EpsC-like NDP-sugar epimerase